MPTYKDITDFIGITNFRKKEPVPSAKDVSNKPNEDEDKYVVEKKEVLYEWDAVARSRLNFSFDVKKNRNFVIIGAVLLLFFIILSEFWLITVVAAAIFLMYVLSSSQGEAVHHRILNIGIEYSGDLYTWGRLKQFFFSTDSSNTNYLCVDTVQEFPSRLFFVINGQDKEKIKEILETYLPYLREEPKDLTDKIYKFVSDKVSIQ